MNASDIRKNGWCCKPVKSNLSALSVILIAIFLCGSSPTLSGASEVLRVGTESTFPPFVLRDQSGDLAGFEIDLLQAIA